MIIAYPAMKFAMVRIKNLAAVQSNIVFCHIRNLHQIKAVFVFGNREVRHESVSFQLSDNRLDVLAQGVIKSTLKLGRPSGIRLRLNELSYHVFTPDFSVHDG